MWRMNEPLIMAETLEFPNGGSSSSVTDIARPSRIDLDIFRSLGADIRNKRILVPGDSEELQAIAKWVVSCDEKSMEHLTRSKTYKYLNQMLSFLCVIASGLSGILSVVMEIGVLDKRCMIATSVLSFAAACAVAVNNSILDAPGKYKEHINAENQFSFLARNMAVTLATYDSEHGAADFKSAAAALKYFHVGVTHANDKAPEL